MTDDVGNVYLTQTKRARLCITCVVSKDLTTQNRGKNFQSKSNYYVRSCTYKTCYKLRIGFTTVRTFYCNFFRTTFCERNFSFTT